jgi:tripartite-type tricarboxylate transporter receptor subunit TctC
MRRRGALFALCLAPLSLAVGHAAARAAYPERPIRLVVPFPPGGGADVLARTIAPPLAKAIGGTIFVDNRPGAGGNLGAEFVARAEPDGYTLLYGTNGTHAINQALYGQLRFDPLGSFAPVSRLTQIAALLVVTPGLPAHTVEDLVRLGRARPGALRFASAGNGTTSHLAGELLASAAGIEVVHVPYRGGAAAIADVAAGHVEAMIDVMPNALPLARAGRVRGLAVSTSRRFPGAPEFPTIAEAGLPGFDVGAWDGLLAPAGTPAAIVERLNAATRRALDEPPLRETLLARGAVPVAGTPEEFARHIAAETRKWAIAVRQSGARLD